MSKGDVMDSQVCGAKAIMSARGDEISDVAAAWGIAWKDLLMHLLLLGVCSACVT